MNKQVVLDANILVRYLRQDDLRFSKKAKEIIENSIKDRKLIYLDEIVIAETIWQLTSLYEADREIIVEKVSKILYLPWFTNPRKILITKALSLYFNTPSLSYIDCWLLVLSKEEEMDLETFDQNLQKKIK